MGQKMNLVMRNIVMTEMLITLMLMTEVMVTTIMNKHNQKDNDDYRNGWVRLCYAGHGGADYESAKKAYLER